MPTTELNVHRLHGLNRLFLPIRNVDAHHVIKNVHGLTRIKQIINLPIRKTCADAESFKSVLICGQKKTDRGCQILLIRVNLWT